MTLPSAILLWILSITFCLALPPRRLFAGPAQARLTTQIAQVGEQCGGADFAGPTACAPSSACIKHHSLYSQCQQVRKAGEPTIPTASPPQLLDSPPESIAKSYQTCGGKDYASRACEAGNSCRSKSEAMSVCMPDSVTESKFALRYEQCGGNGFRERPCISWTRCVKVDDDYSQCL